MRSFAALLALALLVHAEVANANCDDAAKAGKPPSSPLERARHRRLGARERGVLGADGRAPSSVVLPAGAKKSDGQAFAATAFVRPAKAIGETPRLYVSWPLIDKAQANKLYDTDSLVIGHELGHRARDLTFEGLRQTKDGGPTIEARADAHGAFFAAIAGYSTRRLACDSALDTFLDVEAHVGESVRAERRKQLAQALLAFDVYESLYEASAGLAFWDSKTARALLTWVDQRLGQDFTPIPEFKILLGLSILMDVAGEAPWTELVRVPGAPNNHLRCTPVFPQHTALWDEVLFSNDEPVGPSRDLGSDLKVAVGHLNDALSLGASPLAAHSALSCAHAYLGDTKKAKGALDQAITAAAGRPAALQSALAGNQAFIAWIDWMRASKILPKTAADADKKKWADGLRKARSSWTTSPSITAWLTPSRAIRHRPRPPNLQPCSARPNHPRAPPAGLACRPAPTRPRRGLPVRLAQLHHLGDPLTSNNPDDGVRTCVPGGWGTGLRWIDVYLPLPDITSRVMIVDAFDGGHEPAHLAKALQALRGARHLRPRRDHLRRVVPRAQRAAGHSPGQRLPRDPRHRHRKVAATCSSQIEMRRLLLSSALCPLLACASTPSISDADVTRGQGHFPGLTRARLEAGQQTYEMRCGACHEAYLPAPAHPNSGSSPSRRCPSAPSSTATASSPRSSTSRPSRTERLSPRRA